MHRFVTANVHPAINEQLHTFDHVTRPKSHSQALMFYQSVGTDLQHGLVSNAHFSELSRKWNMTLNS